MPAIAPLLPRNQDGVVTRTVREAPRPSVSEARSATMLPAPRVLVVDDQPDNVELLALMLRSKGYTVVQAADGETALRMIRANPPDLVLLDVLMPALNGLQVTTAIRSDPGLPFIPIILITAQHALDHKIDGLDAGADEFLSKPVQARELLAKVRALLRLKQAQDALVAERNKTSLLYRIQQQLTSTLDVDEVINATLQLMMQAVRASEGSMIVFDPHGKPWRHTLGADGASATQTADVLQRILQHGLAGVALRLLAPQRVDDTSTDERWITLPEYSLTVRSAVALPLRHADAMLGVLTLTHPEPYHFTAADVELLAAAAGQISTALHNAALYSLLSEAERGRERFLHMLAHDLRGPLAGIAGCLYLLADGTVEPRLREYVDLAQMACRTQEHLIDDILDVYKAQSGLMELRCAPVSLHEIGAELLVSLQGAAAERALHFQVNLPARPLVVGDRDKLLRVLLNLVGNAIKFTREGGVYVTATPEAGSLTVAVRDTGTGMRADEIPHIFDRFFQGTERGARRGTGLGLTFCREVIQAHGGRIWAESTLGVGTILQFTLTLHNEEL